MQERKDTVDHAGLFEQCLPGKGTQQEIHPHGKDEDKYDHAVLAAFPAAQDHGKRVREQQTDHSCDQGQKEREL